MDQQYSGLKGGGFEAFLTRGLNQSGGRRLDGRARGKKRGYKYMEGPFKGLTQGQATEKARSMYAGLGDSERRRYEGVAAGDDIRSSREKMTPTVETSRPSGVQGASGVEGAKSKTVSSAMTPKNNESSSSAEKLSAEEKRERARITAAELKKVPKLGSIERDDPRTAAYRRRGAGPATGMSQYNALASASGRTVMGR